MWALHPGQFVEGAASLTSCFRLHSKQATCRFRCRPHNPSNLRKPVASDEVVVSSLSFSPDGLELCGAKARPHWRHMVVLAAAYSICLKPQCGHSTLSLTGDDFATGYC